MTCPRCHGSGEGGAGFVTRTSGCAVLPLPCRTCGGSGRVDDGYPDRALRGEALRERRRALDLGLRAFATLVGARPSEVSAVERGDREAPAAWFVALAEKEKTT